MNLLVNNPILVGDIGGTNARFAIAEGVEARGEGCSFKLSSKQVFEVQKPDTLSDILNTYLARLEGVKPKMACFGVAGQMRGDEVKLTNAHWVFSPRQIQKDFAFTKLDIVNDFQAMARGAVAPQSSPSMITIKSGHNDQQSPIAVLGPGTGLGLGIALPSQGNFRVIPTEGGHAAFAPRSEEEIEIFRIIGKNQNFVSAEKLLSGRGLVNIYKALCELHGETSQDLRPEDVTKGAIDQSLPMGRRAVDLFCTILGGYAGDVAVMTGARGGIIIAGGIVPRIKDILLQSAFAERFLERDVMSAYVEAIGIDLLMSNDDAALLGAALCLRQ